MQSALRHPDVVDTNLAEEMENKRVVGPFLQATIPEAHISRFGIILKPHSGKWHLIIDLSHPKHNSMNDGILCAQCLISLLMMQFVRLLNLALVQN